MAELQWWCSARGEPWTWAWRAYPGIWIVVALIAVLAWRLRRGRAGGGDEPAWWRTASGILGLVLLWLSLDWPVGPLGTGYLASAHALQFVLLAMLVPAMLLLAVDRERIAKALSGRRLPVLRELTHPVLAAIGFAIVMIVTHAPRVVDTFMALQLGAMVLDLAWLVSGFWLWWPVLVGVPERPWFTPPLHVLYLFLATQAHMLIAMWLITAEFPLYATYELAPRVIGFNAMEDQQIAGGVMLTLGGPLVLGAITVIFLRWAAAQEREDRLGA